MTLLLFCGASTIKRDGAGVGNFPAPKSPPQMTLARPHVFRLLLFVSAPHAASSSRNRRHIYLHNDERIPEDQGGEPRRGDGR